jgi:UDP-N-acetylmuramoyl-tripeptide--D-alanyl-D-alanine ligase
MKKQMPNMSLKNIALACEGTYIGDEAFAEKVICGAVIDSRLVEEDYLLFQSKENE